MPNLPARKEGAAVNTITKKIEQLGEEHLLLMQNIQITSDQQEGYTTQLRVMSDQEAQLNDTQNSIRPFLLSVIAKANATLADSNAHMIAISNMITAQESELRACHNDGLGQRNNDFAKESSPTNLAVQVKDYLQKRDITGVTDPATSRRYPGQLGTKDQRKTFDLEHHVLRGYYAKILGLRVFLSSALVALG
jgi:hypothetical protein